MKKLYISIFITSVLNLTSCYSYLNVSKEKFVTQTKQRDAFLITDDGTEYRCEADEYLVKRDSLKIMNLSETADGNLVLIKSIHIDDIAVYKLEKFDPIKSVLLIAGIAAISYLIGSAVVKGTMPESFNFYK